MGQKSGAHQQVCMPQDPATKVLGDFGVSHFHHEVRVPGEGRRERPWRAWRGARAHGVDSMALTSPCRSLPAARMGLHSCAQWSEPEPVSLVPATQKGWDWPLGEPPTHSLMGGH